MLKREKHFMYIINLALILIIMVLGLEKNNIVKANENKTNINYKIPIFVPIEIPVPTSETNNWPYSPTEEYLLAKIAMCEAENQDIKTKALIIATVLNRVESSDFPDSISEVILQESNGVYQFSPTMPNGRWYNVEPNEECFKALEVVKNNTYDSQNALYFESCEGDSWHSRNLKFLYQSDDMRFYK